MDKATYLEISGKLKGIAASISKMQKRIDEIYYSGAAKPSLTPADVGNPGLDSAVREFSAAFASDDIDAGTILKLERILKRKKDGLGK